MPGAGFRQATTLSTTFEADLTAYARSGWTAMELWLTKLETHLEAHPLAEVQARLADLNLTPAAAATQGGLLLAHGLERETHWESFRRRLDLLGAFTVPVLIVAADFVHDLAPEDFSAIGSLREAVTLAKPYGVRLAWSSRKGPGSAQASTRRSRCSCRASPRPGSVSICFTITRGRASSRTWRT